MRISQLYGRLQFLLQQERNQRVQALISTVEQEIGKCLYRLDMDGEI